MHFAMYFWFNHAYPRQVTSPCSTYDYLIWPNMGCCRQSMTVLSTPPSSMGFLNDQYKANPMGKWEKILVAIMRFAHTFGQCRLSTV